VVSPHFSQWEQEAMEWKRRTFLAAAIPAAVAASFGFRAAGAFTQPQNPQAHPPSNPPFPQPPQNPFPEDTPKPDPKQILKHNKEQIEQDIEKLYSLASELKEQAGKTDSTVVLSLPLVQKAEEIEKLAKQIKNLARGS
jgi:hypothetical protein